MTPPPPPQSPRNYPSREKWIIGLAIGLTVGVIIGVFLDEILMGTVVGIGLGTALAVAFAANDENDEADGGAGNESDDVVAGDESPGQDDEER